MDPTGGFMPVSNTVIMGAAGRDFHNFNVLCRDNPEYNVVAFTATQIPDIDGRRYPAELAGARYPDGIPILKESDLAGLIQEQKVDKVIFSYSDVNYHYVMHKAAAVSAAGASFVLPAAGETMLESKRPVISVCAVRTGCGKSQTTRRVAALLRASGQKVAIVRHPMPYGDLLKQVVQRFESYEDLDRFDCTIEEREEYEPHIDAGSVVFAGVDYQKVLRAAESEADIVLWDGGNNDTPFFRSDLKIVVVDPLRPGHETSYYPGEINLRMADVVVINKETTANYDDIERVRESVHEINPAAVIIDAASPITVDSPQIIADKRVLAVEDGPTLTHGEMKYGAAVVAAQRYGASEIIDPRPYLSGSLKDTFATYPEIGNLLPAMGYGEGQVKDLQDTINAVDCDAVIIGTPIDLRRLIQINKPATRTSYHLQEIGTPDLAGVLDEFLNK
jgi:predicted GTPase